MPNDDYDFTTELHKTTYRKLDMEIKRPNKLGASLWLAAGIGFVLFLFVLMWLAYHNRL